MITEDRESEDLVPLCKDEFKAQLTQIIPHLQDFGRSLSGYRDLADDLVQETLLEARAARAPFQDGTDIEASTFTMLCILPCAVQGRVGRPGCKQDPCGARQPGPAYRAA